MATLGAGALEAWEAAGGGSMPIQGPRSPELWRVAVIANASAIPRIRGCVCAVATLCAARPFTEPRMFATPWLSYRTHSAQKLPGRGSRLAARGRFCVCVCVGERTLTQPHTQTRVAGREMERRPYVRRPRLWPCQKEPGPGGFLAPCCVQPPPPPLVPKFATLLAPARGISPLSARRGPHPSPGFAFLIRVRRLPYLPPACPSHAPPPPPPTLTLLSVSFFSSRPTTHPSRPPAHQ